MKTGKRKVGAAGTHGVDKHAHSIGDSYMKQTCYISS
jgi:hypothetical protein